MNTHLTVRARRGRLSHAGARKAATAALVAVAVALGLLLPVTPALAAPAAAVQSVTAKTTTVATVSNLANGPGLFSTADGKVAAGARAFHTYQVTGAVGSRKGLLQRLDGGKWVTIQTVWFKQSTGNTATFHTPLTSGTVTRKYRVQIAATAREKAWTSNPVTIQHVDPKKYTGYKKAAYNYMKPYCDKPVINLIDGWFSYAQYPSNQIDLSTQLGTGKVMQYIALHECAHLVSFRVYANDMASFGPRMDKIYGSFPHGVEALADCMAFAMGADATSNGSYTRDCSGYRGTAARMVLRGQKP